MELEYKPDFESTRRQWDDFWAGRMERPLLSLRAPKQPGASLTPPPKSQAYGKEGKVEDWLDTLENYFDNTLFLNEAVPAVPVSFAPDHFSTLLGSDIHLNPDNPETGWVEPFVEDWDKAEIKLRKDGYWWERTFEFIRAFRRRFDGRAMLCPPNIQGGLDCLSAIRGNQELLFDLIDCPEKVEEALGRVNQAVRELQNIYKEEMDVAAQGSVNRHLFYSSDQLIGVPQCDFSCMISQDMFRHFQLPALREELKQLGDSDYHLDGPDAIQHLEAICELDKVTVIQWQPGAASMDQDWTWLYDRIDALGRGLIIVGEDAIEKAEKLWRRLNSRKLAVFSVYESVEEAEKITEKFNNLSKE